MTELLREVEARLSSVIGCAADQVEVEVDQDDDGRLFEGDAVPNWPVPQFSAMGQPYIVPHTRLGPSNPAFDAVITVPEDHFDNAVIRLAALTALIREYSLLDLTADSRGWITTDGRGWVVDERNFYIDDEAKFGLKVSIAVQG